MSELTRAQHIREACREAGCSDRAQEFITAGWSADQVRKSLLGEQLPDSKRRAKVVKTAREDYRRRRSTSHALQAVSENEFVNSVLISEGLESHTFPSSPSMS